MSSARHGNSVLPLSRLGLGAAGLGGAYGTLDERAAIATVHRAFELGVTWFDASPYYGATQGESVLGKALRDLPREQFVLSTKAGRYGVDSFDFRPERLRRSLDESLRRLQVDHLDLFLLHDVEFGDLTRILDESLPALAALRATGKVRSIGLSGLPLAIFRRVLAAGVPCDVALSYCHATLLDRSLCELAPALAAAGITVLNASPAAMGLLSNQGPPAWHPAPADLRQVCRSAAALCRSRGVELAELALSYTMTLPGIAATVSGAVSPQQLEANVRAAAAAPDPELLAAVQAVLAPNFGQTWPQGRAENQ
ncbi:MAG: aldo/keto reductase [Planctomycetes bacterium]|nr:aldo/keto reductase [Planctomycetota bacterium]